MRSNRVFYRSLDIELTEMPRRARFILTSASRVGVTTLFIEPASPWENGYCESYSKLRDELLAGEQFSTLHEAKVLIEQWRRHYKCDQTTLLARYRPPAPETSCRQRLVWPERSVGQSRRWPTAAGFALMPGIATWGRPVF